MRAEERSGNMFVRPKEEDLRWVKEVQTLLAKESGAGAGSKAATEQVSGHTVSILSPTRGGSVGLVCGDGGCHFRGPATATAASPPPPEAAPPKKGDAQGGEGHCWPRPLRLCLCP